VADLTDKELAKAIRDARSSGADVYLTGEGKARGVGRLRVRARPTGQCLFYFRYTNSGGKQEQLPIGVYDPTPKATRASSERKEGRAGLTLSEARDKAGELSKRYQRGEKDLRVHVEHDRAQDRARIEEARRAREEAERQERIGSLRALLDGYVEYLEKGAKQSATDARNIFKRNVYDASPEIAAMRASAVTRDDINTVLEPLLDAGKGRTAAKLRAYLRAAYSLTLQAGSSATIPASLRNFRLTSNPVASVSAKPLAQFNRARERTLNQSELKGYMKALDALPMGMSRDALWLALLLGGQRPAQLLRAKPIDIDVEGGVILLRDPKGARANPRLHRLPLVDRAAEIVNRVLGDVEKGYDGKSTCLFTNNGRVPVRVETLSATVAGISKDMVEAKTAREPFELRDIRRTCETMLAAMGVSRDIRAQILSHGIGGVQDRHYDRHGYMDEKRAALDAWDQRLKEIAQGKKRVSNVVEMARRSA
jgi:integrase